MAFEALNNASQLKSNFIIVLNDNQMSIAENVGGISQYLNGLRSAEGYNNFKEGLQNTLEKIPVYGEGLVRQLKKTKSGLKQLVIRACSLKIWVSPIWGLWTDTIWIS